LLIELHEMRMLLEPELAAKAAASVDAATLERLRSELDRMAGLLDDPESYLEADYEFHMEICRAADNRILDRIMYSARWLLSASRRVTNEGPNALQKATEAHRGIYVALEAGDAELARERMRAHLLRNTVLLAGNKPGRKGRTRRT
jgi:DNA-binding FadR family transcriptional regulator